MAELPVSLREKRNANEILICCLGFYVTAFVPRYCSSSSVRRGRCEGHRDQGGKGERGLGSRRVLAAGRIYWSTEADEMKSPSLRAGASASPAGEILAGGKPFLFFSVPFFFAC